ncbi:GAF domain-containing protein, partial [Candidatus Gracilibacteria bacterium]|nr:GAF domain-containing protein [Candidatus Gracilibacteria bacterium]
MSSQVLRSAQPIFLPHFVLEDYRAAVDDERLRNLALPNIHSVMVVPLMARGSVFGTLSLTRDQTHEAYTADDLLLAEDIAERAAFALDNALLLAEARIARAIAESDQRRLRVLADVSQQLATVTTDIDRLFYTVTACIATTIGDLCALRLLSPDGAGLLTTQIAHPNPAAHRFMNELGRLPQAMDESYTKAVIEHAQVVRIATVPETIRAQLPQRYLPYIDRFGIASLLIVPLIVRGRVIGSLTLVRDRGGAPFRRVGEFNKVLLPDNLSCNPG